MPTPLARVLAFVTITIATFLWIQWRDLDRGDFRIDEAHKISETVFLRLLLSGDFEHELWAAHPVDRANPPVGKYVFGAAILLHGSPLPSLEPLSSRSGSLLMPPVHPPALSEPYRYAIPAVRNASAVVTSLTAALLFVWVLSHHSFGAAALALSFYLSSYLTQTFAATGVFDPLLSLFILASAVCATARPSAARWLWIYAGLAGISVALAFQTRVSGALVLPAVLLGLALARRPDLRTPFPHMALTLATFAIVSLAVNPYYWGSTSGDDIVALPARIIERLSQQYADLQRLSGLVMERGGGFDSTPEKLRFASEVLFGDLSGLLLFFALAGGVIMLALRHIRPSSLGVQVAVAVTIVLTMVVWLPVSWPRHLLVTIPHLAASGGVICAMIAERVVAAIQVPGTKKKGDT